MIDLKYYIHKGLFSPYIKDSAGWGVVREVSGGEVNLDGEAKYFSTIGYPSLGGGMGVEYWLNHRWGFFLEAQYITFWYRYWHNDDDPKLKSIGITPLKVGIMFSF